MTHRDPDAERRPCEGRPARSHPYEIAALLACAILAVAAGLHERQVAEAQAAPAHFIEPAPAPVG